MTEDEERRFLEGEFDPRHPHDGIIDWMIRALIGCLLGFALAGLVIMGILFTFRVLNTLWPAKPPIRTMLAEAPPQMVLRSGIIKTGGALRHPSPLKAVLESRTTNTGEGSGDTTEIGDPSADPVPADNTKNGDAR